MGERQSRAWRKLRTSYGNALPLPCRRCGQLIMPWDRWELGHVVDVADGGTAAQGAWPEHSACNQRASRPRPHSTGLPPSRRW